MANTRARKREAITKRIQFLDKRVADAQAVGRDLSYDKQEAGALRWLLDIEQKYFEREKILLGWASALHEATFCLECGGTEGECASSQISCCPECRHGFLQQARIDAERILLRDTLESVGIPHDEKSIDQICAEHGVKTP